MNEDLRKAKSCQWRCRAVQCDHGTIGVLRILSIFFIFQEFRNPEGSAIL